MIPSLLSHSLYEMIPTSAFDLGMRVMLPVLVAVAVLRSF